MRRILTFLVLAAVSALAQQWEFEQVDDLRSAGLQMRRAPDGALYLCYCQSDGTIRIARRDTAWHFENVDTLVARGTFGGPSFAVSPAGDLALAAMRGLQLDYVTRTDTGWDAESTGFVGTHDGISPTLGFDNAGLPNIACCYNGYDSPGGVLLLTRANSAWTTDTVYWVVPQQMYAYLCSVSDLEWDAAGIPHVFTTGGGGMADGDPPWTYSIGTWTPSGESWLCRFVAGGGTFGNAMGLDLTTDSGCRERVCFDSGNYSAIHFCCDSAMLNSTASYDAAIQVDPLGQSQVAFVIDSVLYFAYRTGYWHTASVPTGRDVGDVELLLDSLGQPLIAFTSQSGVWLAHGAVIVDQSEERQTPTANGLRPTASVVRNVLFLPTASGHKLQAASLLDAGGRRIMELAPGANDVSKLSPGVYFVRNVQTNGVRKVLLAR